MAFSPEKRELLQFKHKYMQSCKSVTLQLKSEKNSEIPTDQVMCMATDSYCKQLLQNEK